MVSTVSTLGQFNYIQSLLQANTTQLDTAQAQLTSGLLATTYAGLGAASTYSSLSLRSENNQLSGYNNNINRVTTYTSAMDAALGDASATDSGSGIIGVASTLVAALQVPTQSGDPGMATLGTEASNSLQQIQEYLNTSVAGRYVFAGTDTQNAPIADTTAITTTTGADLTAFANGTESAAQLLSNYNVTGVNATATASVTTGAVTSIGATNLGTGYTTPPTVTLSGGGGTGATAVAIVSNGSVVGYTITNPGTGYTSAPTVTVAPTPALATATSTVAAGAVTGLTVTNGGAFYTYPPTITLVGGGGTGATATATVSNGVITGYTITNPGTGYTSAPSVQIATGYTQTQLGYSSSIAAAKNVTVRSGDNIDTDYTVKANNSCFQQIQQGMAIIANLQYNSTDSTGFYQVYNAAISMIQSGVSGATLQQAKLGIATKTLTDTQTTISASQTTISSLISNVEDTNTAAVTTELQNLESQLQVSYNVIGQLQNLSLVNYLNTG